MRLDFQHSSCYIHISQQRYCLFGMIICAATCVPNEDSNQSAHPHSQIRDFVFRMRKICILGYPKYIQWRFWSDCAHAQANLNLRWAHMSKGTFLTLRLIYIYIWHHLIFNVVYLQLKDFQSQHQVLDVFSKAIETVETNILWMTKHHGVVKTWLEHLSMWFVDIMFKRGCSLTKLD